MAWHGGRCGQSASDGEIAPQILHLCAPDINHLHELELGHLTERTCGYSVVVCGGTTLI